MRIFVTLGILFSVIRFSLPFGHSVECASYFNKLSRKTSIDITQFYCFFLTTLFAWKARTQDRWICVWLAPIYLFSFLSFVSFHCLFAQNRQNITLFFHYGRSRGCNEQFHLNNRNSAICTHSIEHWN